MSFDSNMVSFRTLLSIPTVNAEIYLDLVHKCPLVTISKNASSFSSDITFSITSTVVQPTYVEVITEKKQIEILEIKLLCIEDFL